MRKWVYPAAIMASLAAAYLVVGEEFNLPKGPCGSAPPAKPQRRKGGEGVPPLPLPATPLRRTERKRSPSPPPLVAKIQYGELKEVERDGQLIRYYDWNKDKGDIPTLLNVANRALKFNYSWKRGGLAAFSTDPAQYPIYYYTGSDDFTLSDQEVARLREFVRSGGTIWGDTCFGDPDFFRAFVREMGRVLPGRHFRRLALNHPIFHCFYQINHVQYTRPVADAPEGEPVFYGVDLGCRTPIILGRYDLSCGWDGHIRKGAMSVSPNDARKLGANMICYALATYNLGLYQSNAKVYYENQERARGDFVFAQAKVGENWDTQFNAIANLLKALTTKTSTEVKFERRAVDLSSGELQKYPFLYLTGHYDFKLSEAEIQALRRFISSGGFLLASACCGRAEFDKAFRREIARVLPGHELKKLPPEHPVYSVFYQLDAVGYDDYVRSLGEVPPDLPMEGISIAGTTPVMYSPYGLGGGWRGFDHPFARDIAHEDAIKLGINIILYSMTH